MGVNPDLPIDARYGVAKQVRSFHHDLALRWVHPVARLGANVAQHVWSGTCAVLTVEGTQLLQAVPRNLTGIYFKINIT
eukprot:SAG31_NODE_5387_length_2571_cov_6.280744_4_plen_78_part_01